MNWRCALSAALRVRVLAGLGVLVASLTAAGCGTSGDQQPVSPAKDTRGGLAGRMSPACARSLSGLDAGSQKRITSITTLASARDRSESKARLLRRTLGKQQARVKLTRRALSRVREPFDQFLAAHPGHTLAPADYSTYVSLKQPYEASLKRVNLAIDASNAAVTRLNKEIAAFNAKTDAANRLLAADDKAGDKADAVESRCLRSITDWNLAVARIEARLEAAARSAGSGSPAIDCESPRKWAATEQSAPGYERAGSASPGVAIIHLAPRTCSALARLVSHPTRLACVAKSRDSSLCPPSLESEALAVVTLAHEEQHVDGVANEAKAQCYALQRARVTARQLGLPDQAAARVAAFTKHSITQPPAYRSSECRRGGILDLHLPAGWPAGL